MKADGEPRLTETQRWDGGAGWIAYPEETMRRASHALVVDGEVWVFDPVDVPGLEEFLGDLGEVAGVVVGIDRHTRDADVVAARHDVPVYIPDWMTGVADDLATPVDRFGRYLPATEIRVIRIRDSVLPPWQEVAFYNEADDTLVVPEAIGSAPYYLTGEETIGVHPMLRLFPPKGALRSLRPERVLTSHGPGVGEDGARALRDALDNARQRLPSLYLKNAKLFL